MVVVLQQMAMGRGQQPGTHGLRRVLHQGQRQAEDEAIHILGKAEAMYAERGHHLQRRLAETQLPALDFQRGVAMLYIEHLDQVGMLMRVDRKSTRLNSSHVRISYAVFCLKKKK